MHISAQDLKRIRRWAERAYPRECCGLLGGRGDRVEALRLAPNPLPMANRFRIPPEFQRRFHQEMKRRRLEVMGVFHSHPDAPPQPSSEDLQFAWPELRYLIVSVTGGRAGEIACWTFQRRGKQVSASPEPLVD